MTEVDASAFRIAPAGRLGDRLRAPSAQLLMLHCRRRLVLSDDG